MAVSSPIDIKQLYSTPYVKLSLFYATPIHVKYSDFSEPLQAFFDVSRPLLKGWLGPDGITFPSGIHALYACHATHLNAFAVMYLPSPFTEIVPKETNMLCESLNIRDWTVCEAKNIGILALRLSWLSKNPPWSRMHSFFENMGLGPTHNYDGLPVKILSMLIYELGELLFMQHAHLRELLLSTGTRAFISSNHASRPDGAFSKTWPVLLTDVRRSLCERVQPRLCIGIGRDDQVTALPLHPCYRTPFRLSDRLLDRATWETIQGVFPRAAEWLTGRSVWFPSVQHAARALLATNKAAFENMMVEGALGSGQVHDEFIVLAEQLPTRHPIEMAMVNCVGYVAEFAYLLCASGDGIHRIPSEAEEKFLYRYDLHFGDYTYITSESTYAAYRQVRYALALIKFVQRPELGEMLCQSGSSPIALNPDGGGEDFAKELEELRAALQARQAPREPSYRSDAPEPRWRSPAEEQLDRFLMRERAKKF